MAPRKWHVKDWLTGQVIRQNLSRDDAQAVARQDLARRRVYPGARPRRDGAGEDQD